MASNEEVTVGIPLRYWVDNEKNRVVMAEASGEFVDVLFSFLTLPLGTIILHESEDKFPRNQSVMIGCIKNLYQSVKHLSTDVFRNGICKRMLLSPRNALEASCQKLKVNVDNTLPTKYFMCNICSPESVSLLSAFDEATCSCGKPMDKEVELLVESKEKPEEPKYDGVFVKGDAMFLIFDDLKVLRSSPSDSLQLLLKHRHKDLSKINGMSEHVSTQKIFHILKQALTSESPLSDVLLENRESKPSYSFSPYTSPSHGKDCVKIKVIVSKSQNKVLFAEVDGDFVDFLVSFLTTPLGSILNLMDGKLSLGSIDNLYASVKDLDLSWFIGSSNKSLLNPKVAPQFGCRNNPLNALQEDNTPKYWYGTPVVKYNMENETKKISRKKEMLRDPPQEMKLFDPRSSVVGSDVHQKYEFMKRPCLFVVTDDLKVIPITTASSFPYPQELDNFKLDDVEEHMVKISKKSHEALNLLRASLTCEKAALTQSLFYLLRKWKYQRWIPFWSVLRRKKKRHGNQKEVEEKESESAEKKRHGNQKEVEEKESESAVVSGMRNRKKDKKKRGGRKNRHMLTITEEAK